ncbi:MAG: hypothetical protein LBU12_08685 [Deltaproteobacteria bacterium]|jgi:hypothetical protein|nr:hypothetical protein [Deltaproteobacteria bacterium]
MTADHALRPARRLVRRLAVPTARLVLGGAFIWAAVAKIGRPQELAETIVGYRLLPEALIAPLALTLPFLELWAALAALAGPPRFRRAGAVLLGLMLAAFMLAAAQGLIRGLDFECGCFGSADSRRPGPRFFLEDALLLAAAVLTAREAGQAARPDKPTAKSNADRNAARTADSDPTAPGPR